METNYRKLFIDGVSMLVLYYDHNKIDFVSWAKGTFGIDNLENLHHLPDPVEFNNYVDRLYYRVNQLKQNVEVIRGLCMELKNEILVPVFGDIPRFQFPPSIRCHLSGAGTASAFHRDGDPQYGVHPDTLNIWIPLTRVSGNNSIYIETEIQSEKFKPVAMEPGEILVFDAFNLKHGSYSNDTLVSRVSIDIRFVPQKLEIARKLGVYAK